MSSATDDGAAIVGIDNTPEYRTGVTVLGELSIYDIEHPEADADRCVRGPPNEWEIRTYLVAILEVELQDRIAQTFSDTKRVGLYATACGSHTIRVTGDPVATVDGEFAHSMCEPVDRLRAGDTAVRAHLAGIVRQTHLPWRADQ